MEKIALENNFENITEGQVYEVFEENNNFYRLQDDSRRSNKYPKSIFAEKLLNINFDDDSLLVQNVDKAEWKEKIFEGSLEELVEEKEEKEDEVDEPNND